MTGEVWRDAALLAVGIPIGNALGHRARGMATELALGRVEILTSATLVTLSVAGLVR